MEHQYHVQGRRVRLAVNRGVVALRFDDSLSLRGRHAAIAKAGLGAWSNRLEIPNEKCTLLRARPKGAGYRTDAAHEKLLSKLRALPGVVRAHPVYMVARGHAVATERIAIGLKPRAKTPAFIHARGWKILEKSPDGLLVQLAPGDRPLTVCAEIERKPGIAYAEPDFSILFGGDDLLAPKMQPIPKRGPNTPPRFYPFRLTKTDEAWKSAQGNARIRIAMLDGGLHPRHPDIAPAVVSAWNATTNSKLINPRAWDWHGTGCAALAAGADVGAAGVKGVGHGCALMLVKLGHSMHVNQPWVTRSSWERRAIDFAWRHGADVMNLSWGSVGPPLAAVAAALDRALTRGREGRGCVIVAAAGDGDGPVQFPATHRGVIAVSATNQFDHAKTPRSRDGEKFWGSSFGPEVAVGAPGVGLYTARGDFQGSGLHTFGFSGSSGSAPLVAGAAGLVLSIRPEMKQQEVRALLLATADKVGDLPYRAGRNDRFGHGRLNVLRAVKRALAGRKKKKH